MQKFRDILPRRHTYNTRDSYVQLAFNVRVNEKGLSALPPCVYLTSKVRGEYYYRARHVRRLGVTHFIRASHQDDARDQHGNSALPVIAI